MKINTSRKKTIIIAGTAALVVVAIITGASLHFINTNKTDTSSVIPAYKTILPQNKTIKTLGGWERVSPPGAAPVFAYADTINDISISVTEQPLPDSFKSKTSEKVAELAESYSATDELEATNTKVYIGTSAKGPQSVIFVKKNLLVLIKSQNRIDNKLWITYINSLN